MQVAASDLLAAALPRLLYHRDLIPRTVLVDYLKILFAFHLARYHLRIMKLLPALVSAGKTNANGGFFLDVTGIPDTPAVRLAERTAAAGFRRVPRVVRAPLTGEKLGHLGHRLAPPRLLRQPPPAL